MTNTPTPDLSPAALEALAERLQSVDHLSVEDCFLQSPLFSRAAVTLRALAAEIERLKAECFSLAAISCGGFYGGDHGHARCTLVDAQRTRAEAAEALLREAAEVLEQVSAAQTRLVYEGIDRGKGHWPAWDDVARAVTAARDLAAKIRGQG